MADEELDDTPVFEEEAFDLDEDLFAFHELQIPGEGQDDEVIDLDEIFASFDEAEEEELPEPVREERPAPESPEPPPVERAEPVETPQPAALAESEPPPAERAFADELFPVAPVQPVYLQAPAKPSRDRAYTRSVLLILVAVTSLNALVALVSLKATSSMRESVWQGVESVSETAQEIRNEAYQQARVWHSTAVPVASPNTEDHPTFELVRQDIEDGQYGNARQRLYALLAVIDRLEPEEREPAEARAMYLIAQTLHMEAASAKEVSG